MFFVFEGIDKTGKTTIGLEIERAIKKKKLPVVLYQFPDYSTVIGCSIKDFLLEKTVHHPRVSAGIFALNRFERYTEMQRKAKDHIVLSVRYSYSGIAYSLLRNPNDPNPQWYYNIEEGLLIPDKVYYLYADPVLLKKRKKLSSEDNVMHESIESQHVVHKMYMKVFEKMNVKYEVVDAQQSLPEIIEFITNNIFAMWQEEKGLDSRKTAQL